MTINVHSVNDVVRVSAVFKDIAGADIDPDTVTLKVMSPSGVVATYAPTRDSLGHYHQDVNATAAGEWHCWWESTGEGKGGEPTEFAVEPSLFA